MCARTATIIGSRNDVFGCRWDVRELRPTNHGFQLAIGWPIRHGERMSGKGYGGPRIIPTRALYRYWRKCQLARDGSIYDLPASRRALQRVRRILGFNFYSANRRWWEDRLCDLSTLTGAEFARLHDVCESDVSLAYKEIFGSRNRPRFWWREQEVASLLLSDTPHYQIAETLDISVGASRRLRHMLIAERA